MPGQRGITVRMGMVMAHTASAADAAELMQRLFDGRGVASGELASIAAEILDVAAAATKVMEAETVAKGVAKARRPLPSSMKRDIRALDGAAALLRHPGAAKRLLTRLREWRAETDCTPRRGHTESGDASESTCIAGVTAYDVGSDESKHESDKANADTDEEKYRANRELDDE